MSDKSFLDHDGLAYFWNKIKNKFVTSFNGRTGAVTPQSGDYTAAMVNAVPKNTAYIFRGRPLLTGFSNNSKWYKIGQVTSLEANFNIQSIAYLTRASNPPAPDICLLGLAGRISISQIYGSVIGLLPGFDTQARIVLCSDGSIWGTMNGRYGAFHTTNFYYVGVTLYDTPEGPFDNPTSDIIWDSYDNSYNVVREGVYNNNELQNPPMTLGVEYRTTERFNGSPVYVKYMSLGLAPDATTKTINLNITGLSQFVSYQMFFNDGAMLPYNHPNGSELEINFIAPYSGGIVIYTTNFNASPFTIQGIFKYTKTG